MILVIDLCYRDGSLSRSEFVEPIEQILREAGADLIIRHYTAISPSDLEAADAVILCGTALKDIGFLKHPGMFRWISESGRPILGISSGMLALAAAFGATTEPYPGIGMTDVRVIAPDPLFAGRETFSAYGLHEYIAKLPPGFIPLALSDRCIQAIRHRLLPLYGLLFHPEVRNEWIVTHFLDMVE
ncbi:MAG: type 1 glutamine amidotransferase [Methanoculleus sp.]